MQTVIATEPIPRSHLDFLDQHVISYDNCMHFNNSYQLSCCLANNTVAIAIDAAKIFTKLIWTNMEFYLSIKTVLPTPQRNIYTM